MYSRLIFPLVFAAAIVFACGLPSRPLAHTSLSLAAPTPEVVGDPVASAPLAAHRRRADTVGVDAGFDVATSEEGVQLALRVVNVSPRKLEMHFPDGRTRDFAVYDADGREVWRWSRGRLFTQTVQNKFLAAHDTAIYREHWTQPRPGQYTAIAFLRSRNFPVERRVTFTVGPTTVAASR